MKPDRVIDLGGERHLELGELIGRGAIANVYRGRLRGTNAVDRQVAVKLFDVVSSEESGRVFGLLLETARRAACIDHPGVARTYECGVWQRAPFVVMEHVDGVSLHNLQARHASKRRRLPLDIALFIGCEVAEALEGARLTRDHAGRSLDVLHQSLGPSEVLLSFRGEVKVTDFETSIARAASSTVKNLRAVRARATAMAPEVAIGDEPDARSDVFSLGVLLHEMLVGPRFPEGISNTDAIRLAREGYVHPLTFRPRLPDGIVEVIDRALSIDPGDRHPVAGAVRDELRGVALSMGVGDARWFLRTMLARELENDPDVTAVEGAAPTRRLGDAPDYEEPKRRT